MTDPMIARSPDWGTGSGRRPRHRGRVVIVGGVTILAEGLELALVVAGHDARHHPLSEHPRPLRSLMTALLRVHPDLAVLDLDLGPHGDGTELIVPLTGAGVEVVVVTDSSDHARWGGCLHRGARAVVHKDQSVDHVLETVRRVLDGRQVLDPGEVEDLMTLWHQDRRDDDSDRERLARLTPRERQILWHMLAGRTAQDIAREGRVSEATVRTQCKSILTKLEVSSRVSAVALARRLDWGRR